jgi:hypothetical protein
MKIKKAQNPFIFLATYYNLSQKSFPLKFVEFGPPFSLKFCCIRQNHILMSKICEISPPNKTLYLASLGMIDGRN